MNDDRRGHFPYGGPHPDTHSHAPSGPGGAPSICPRCGGSGEVDRAAPSTEPALDALRAVAEIVRRHTHQGRWAMTQYAGDPEHDCHLCRALVAASVLTLDEIGVGTRAAILAESQP